MEFDVMAGLSLEQKAKISIFGRFGYFPQDFVLDVACTRFHRNGKSIFVSCELNYFYFSLQSRSIRRSI